MKKKQPTLRATVRLREMEFRTAVSSAHSAVIVLSGALTVGADDERGRARNAIERCSDVLVALAMGQIPEVKP